MKLTAEEYASATQMMIRANVIRSCVAVCPVTGCVCIHAIDGCGSEVTCLFPKVQS